MARILALLAMLASAGPVISQDKSDPKIAAFWAWFVANSEDLAKILTGREPICATLKAELTKVEKGLTWEFGPTIDGAREFTVSADGAKELFPRVKAVIAAAPPLPAWKVVAFRQRKPVKGMMIQLGAEKIDVSEILFRAVREGTKVGLTVYIKGMTPKNEKSTMTQGFILLDYSLGEVDMETRIGSIEFLPLTDKVEKKDLHPLPDLPAEVDRLGK
jgi:hypothetical protein